MKGVDMSVKYLDLDFIENLADDLRINSGYADREIDIEDIANQLGFHVYGTEFADSNISGQVINKEDRKEIYVADESYERQRFTIAHEIGHIILHHQGLEEKQIIDYRKSRFSDNGKEFQANAFAAALLMPKERAITVWSKLKDIDDFATFFEVSKQAASIRLLSLGLI